MKMRGLSKIKQTLRRLRKSGFTLTVPEQAQGASKVLVLSNSSSWHILQREIPESNFKSSTNKTTSSMFLAITESSISRKTSTLVGFPSPFTTLFSSLQNPNFIYKITHHWTSNTALLWLLKINLSRLIPLFFLLVSSLFLITFGKIIHTH